ncbi:MAG: hypothetical protein KBE23_05315 [Chloroflexi bacterium]|nr:hypothetical protein [Chloroflexota bacterium]MBP7042139.1 hypothetical protein [Chloroflexota bacterium]
MAAGVRSQYETAVSQYTTCGRYVLLLHSGHIDLRTPPGLAPLVAQWLTDSIG